MNICNGWTADANSSKRQEDIKAWQLKTDQRCPGDRAAEALLKLMRRAEGVRVCANRCAASFYATTMFSVCTSIAWFAAEMLLPSALICAVLPIALPAVIVICGMGILTGVLTFLSLGVSTIADKVYVEAQPQLEAHLAELEKEQVGIETKKAVDNWANSGFFDSKEAPAVQKKEELVVICEG